MRFHLLQHLTHGLKGVGIGGLEAARIGGAAAHGHLAVETVHLLLVAPRLQQIVRGPQLTQAVLNVAERIGRRNRRGPGILVAASGSQRLNRGRFHRLLISGGNDGRHRHRPNALGAVVCTDCTGPPPGAGIPVAVGGVKRGASSPDAELDVVLDADARSKIVGQRKSWSFFSISDHEVPDSATAGIPTTQANMINARPATAADDCMSSNASLRR